MWASTGEGVHIALCNFVPKLEGRRTLHCTGSLAMVVEGINVEDIFQLVSLILSFYILDIKILVFWTTKTTNTAMFTKYYVEFLSL